MINGTTTQEICIDKSFDKVINSIDTVKNSIYKVVKHIELANKKEKLKK